MLPYALKENWIMFSFPHKIDPYFGFCLNSIFGNNCGKLELETGDRVYCCFCWHTIFKVEIGVLLSHVQDLKSCQAGWQEGIFLTGYICQNCACDGAKGGFARGCCVGHKPFSRMNLPQPLTRRGFWFIINSNQIYSWKQTLNTLTVLSSGEFCTTYLLNLK